MKPYLLFIVGMLLTTQILSSSKTLSQSCQCDVSSNCDSYCCCDGDCSSSATQIWNTYSLCGNDGYNIPLCSNYYTQPIHIHDLSQGLRLIYTVIQSLFCISRVNFVNISSNFQSTSTNSQLPSIPASVPAINQLVLNLNSINYSALPMRNSLGQCTTTSAYDMNNIQNERCFIYVSTSTNITLLNPSKFVTANNLINTSLNVYIMQSNTLTSVTTVSALSTTFTCTPSATATCYVIKQIKLFFIRGTTTTIDYTSSYLVVGLTSVTSNSYIYLTYSIQFQAQSLSFPYSSPQGYTVGSPLNLLMVNSSSTSYYKIFNPINLASKKNDGTCRNGTADAADSTNLIELAFGVNTIFSCILGNTSLMYSSITSLFNYIGAFGLSSTNLNDYVQLSIPSTITSTQNLQLLFYYISIGTNLNPQYQIVSAKLNGLANTATSQTTSLFIQYQQISSNIFINIPSPPTVNAYLPDDFLYPFFVA